MESLADGVSSPTVEKIEYFEEIMEHLADGISSRTVEEIETFFVLDGVTHKGELTSLETNSEVENGDFGVANDVIVEYGSSSIEEKVSIENCGEVENVIGSVSEVEMNSEKCVENVDVKVVHNGTVNYGSSSIEEKISLEHGSEVDNVKKSVLEVEMKGKNGVANVEACDSSMVFVDGEKFDGVVSVFEVNKNAENYPEKRETSNGLRMSVDIAIKDGRDLNENGGLKSLKKSKYNAGDFVWVKIRNNTWWPGQIYDPGDASEVALKHKRMNLLLVAYSGDGTFAWCKPSQLKPFHEKYVNFSKQSSKKEGMAYALQLTLEKIGELVEWNMTCSCALKQSQIKLSGPIADNSGLKNGLLMPINGQSKLNQFEPAQILADLKHLSQGVSMDNMLEIKLMKSKLSAFYRSKGGYKLPEYHFPQNIIGLEDKNPNSGKVDVSNQTPVKVDWPKTTVFYNLGQRFLQKNPLISEEKLYGRRKCMSIADMINADMDTEPNYEKKDKLDQTELESEFMPVPSSVKVSELMNIAPSKLFSSNPSPLFKCSAEKHKNELSKGPDVEMVIDTFVTKASPNEMLSELCDAASGHLYKRFSDKKRKFAGSESDPNAPESIFVQKKTKKHEPIAPGSFAALLMTFSPGLSLPSKDDLIETYREFGSLDKEETKVMVNSSCAQVVFVSTEDAEQAYNHSMCTKKDDTITYTIRYLNHGSNARELDNSNTSDSPLFQSMKQKLEMMISVVDNSDCNISEEKRNNLMGKLKILSDKVSTM